VQPLNASAIGQPYRDKISTQDYTGKPAISGVEFLALRQFLEEGGDFMEMGRFTTNGELVAKPGFQVTQMNWSRVLPGAIKAFHLHFNQEDVWFIPPTDRVLIGLLDARQDSPTFKQAMRFTLGGGQTRLLYIPRGVAHGAANLGSEPAQVIYFVNQQFSAEDPDERRLPWDTCGADFWTIQPG
jgi:dTDP-4-dehydrorhamnose 3,5-epimerase